MIKKSHRRFLRGLTEEYTTLIEKIYVNFLTHEPVDVVKAFLRKNTDVV